MKLKPWSPDVVVTFDETNLKGARSGDAGELVTVCVTAFNYARYLPQCLNSILAQTHPNLELFVVDDKSSGDNSLQVATEWAQANASRFHRICVISHLRNQGPAEARNTGFSRASGDYVFIIDADNEIYPRAISRLLSAARSGSFDATYSQLEVFGIERRIGMADIWDINELAKENYVDIMALVARSAWKQVGGFSHIEEGWEDYDFWLKFVDSGLKVAYVPEILCRYRTHKDSRTYTEAHVAHENLKILMALRHPVVLSAARHPPTMRKATIDKREE